MYADDESFKVPTFIANDNQCSMVYAGHQTRWRKAKYQVYCINISEPGMDAN